MFYTGKNIWFLLQDERGVTRVGKRTGKTGRAGRTGRTRRIWRTGTWLWCGFMMWNPQIIKANIMKKLDLWTSEGWWNSRSSSKNQTFAMKTLQSLIFLQTFLSVILSLEKDNLTKIHSILRIPLEWALNSSFLETNGTNCRSIREYLLGLSKGNNLGSHR